MECADRRPDPSADHSSRSDRGPHDRLRLNHQGLQGFQESVGSTRPRSFSFCTWSDTRCSSWVAESAPARTYRVPFYPVVPLLFCLSSAYMFFKTLDYAVDKTPRGLLASVVVLGIGALLALVE